MLNKINHFVLSYFASLITFFAAYTVNSACAMGLGQTEEPESLNRLKK